MKFNLPPLAVVIVPLLPLLPLLLLQACACSRNTNPPIAADCGNASHRPRPALA